MMEKTRTKVQMAVQCPKCKHCIVVTEKVNKNNQAVSEIEDIDWIEKSLL